MIKERRALEIVELPIEKLVPNPWNVNRMSEAMAGKLAAYLRKEGLVEPIVVRRQGDAYQILGGYHRWKICSERLGYKKMPCVVIDLDDKRAKVLSVNLNEMSGQPVPILLAELVHDLNREIALEDLETLLPYSKSELEDSLELLKLPEDLEAMLEEEAKREEAEAPVVVTVVFDKQQAEVFDAAMDKAQAEVGAIKNRKGRAVELMARAYLSQADRAKM